LSSKPIERVERLEKWWGSESEKNKSLSKPYVIQKKQGIAPARLHLTMDTANSFEIIFSNNKEVRFVIGYNATTKQYFMDRTKSGITSFHPDFAGMHTAPRFSTAKNIQLDLIIDKASVELFADDGLTVMTELYFSTIPYTKMEIRSTDKKGKNIIQHLKWHPLKQL
jgi:fructan beta-fructosidase